MTFIGRAPVRGAVCPLEAGPTAKRYVLAAAAASALVFSSANVASAAPWTMTFEDEVTVGDGLIDHGEKVGTKWSSTVIPGSNVNVTISAYDRSTTGLPSGTANSSRRPVAFDTNMINTLETDLQVKNNSNVAQGFLYASGVEARPAGTAVKYNPGNVLILDNTSTGSCNAGTGICTSPDSHDSGGLFVFSFSAPVTLSSLDVFDTTYGVISYQKVSFYDAAGAEIYVTPGSVNIADALVNEGTAQHPINQLYLPNTGDSR